MGFPEARLQAVTEKKAERKKGREGVVGQLELH